MHPRPGNRAERRAACRLPATIGCGGWAGPTPAARFDRQRWYDGLTAAARAGRFRRNLQRERAASGALRRRYALAADARDVYRGDW